MPYFILSVSLLAAWLPAPQQKPAAPLSAESIVAASINARGGAEALKRVASMKRVGSTMLNGAPVPVTTWAERPSSFRREMQVQGMTITIGSDGKTFWSSNGSSAQPVSGAALERAMADAAFDPPLLDYAKRGDTVKLVGTRSEGGRPVHQIQLKRANGRIEEHFIDGETYLETRTVSTVTQMGVQIEVAREFSDYRRVGTLVLPFLIREYASNALVSETTIESIELSVPIEASLFSMPRHDR
jgi:hypothetical protein